MDSWATKETGSSKLCIFIVKRYKKTAIPIIRKGIVTVDKSFCTVGHTK